MGGPTCWSEALGTKARPSNSDQSARLCQGMNYRMQRVITNGLLSNPEDGFAGDTAEVRGLALLSIFIHDQNDGIERIMRFADDTVLGVAVHRRTSSGSIAIRKLEIQSKNPGKLMSFYGIARKPRLQKEPGVAAGHKLNASQEHQGAARRHCSRMHFPPRFPRHKGAALPWNNDGSGAGAISPEGCRPRYSLKSIFP